MVGHFKKELYELIKKDERIFKLTQEGSVDGIWFWDLAEPASEWMHSKFWTLLAYDPRKIPSTANAWQGIINQHDLEAALLNLSAYLKTPKHHYEQTVRYKHANGSTVWIRCKAMLIQQTENSPAKMLGIHQDVTAIKHKETSARVEINKTNAPTARHQAAYDNAPVAFHSLDRDGIFMDINSKWIEILGYSRKEVIGKWFGDFLHPEYLTVLRANFPVLQKKGSVSNVKYKIKKKSGEYISIVLEGKAIYDEQGLFKKTFCSFKDITAEELSNTKLRMFNQVLEHSLIAFSILDHNVKFIYANQAYADIWGYKSTTKIIGSSLSKHCADNSLPDIIIDKLKKNGFYVGEFKAKREDGCHFDVRMYAHVDHDENGNKIYPTTSIDITEQKRIKLALQENEEKFRGVFDNANIGIALANEHGDQVNVNNEFLCMLGYSKDEFLAINFVDITHPNDLDAELSHLKKMSAGAINNYSLEKRIRHKNGDYIWVDASIAARRGADKKTSMYIVMAKDISRRKKSEDSLNETLREQSLILENDPTLIIFKDKDNNILRITDTVAQVTGLPKDQIEGKASKDVYPEMADKYYTDDLEVMHSRTAKKGIIEPLPMANGKIKWLLTDKVPYFNHENEIAGIIVFSTDVTELKENEQKYIKKSNEFEALSTKLESINKELIASQKVSQTNERKLRNLLSNLKGIAYQCRKDDDWTMLFISKGVEELTGYRVEEVLLNKVVSWNEIIHNDHRAKVASEVSTAINNQVSFTIEYKIKCKNGEEKWVWEKGFADTSNNSDSLIEGFITDITPLKTIEKDLIASKEKAEEANRLKTEFLNNMSHEIRTPMNGIIGFSRMLDDPIISHEKRSYYAKIVQNSSNQLLRIIDDILEISTLETKQNTLINTEFCLNDFLMELFSIFSIKANERDLPLYIKKGLDDEQSHIVSDQLKLHKIMSNLLENSLKYTIQGYIEFGYYVDQKQLVLYVKDTGIGIAPKNHQIIFERFSQENKELSEKTGGLGLGLSISQENATLLGGNISLKSDKGNGATFYVNIPHHPGAGVNTELFENNPQVESKPTEATYNILIAEDEEINYLYLEALFQGKTTERYNLLHARNGKEAVDYCINEQKIDLVLMDIKMPIMNGHEAAKKIKALQPGMPIIALTAYSSQSDKNLALRNGCDEFLSKPISAEVLFVLIKKYLKF